MTKPELLLPAGNIEKLHYAAAYGADAAYFGIGDYSLRYMKAGEVITADNIVQAIKKAQESGIKAYVTVNIFARNDDINKLPQFLEILKEEKPDAFIFSDFGVYNVLKKQCPDIPLHVSTQANTLNSEAVKFWRDNGIARVILARELSLSEIAEISQEVPDIELEVFVHGSLCVSYSGRCLLSEYMTTPDRSSNRGNCTQPCRWKYKLVEEKRPGEYFDITQDEKGCYILNPRDIALIEHIPALIESGVQCFKIEGRTKSLYYVAVTARAYRKAIDAYLKGEKINAEDMLKELSLAGNRGFTTEFYENTSDPSRYNYANSKGTAKADFMGLIEDKIENNVFKVIVKNQFMLNQKIEIMTPSETIQSEIIAIEDIFGNSTEKADTNKTVYIKIDKDVKIWKDAIIRSMKD